MSNMEIDVKSAVAEIESTTDLLERALKLSGLVTTMFQEIVESWGIVGRHLFWRFNFRRKPHSFGQITPSDACFGTSLRC